MRAASLAPFSSLPRPKFEHSGTRRIPPRPRSRSLSEDGTTPRAYAYPPTRGGKPRRKSRIEITRRETPLWEKESGVRKGRHPRDSAASKERDRASSPAACADRSAEVRSTLEHEAATEARTTQSPRVRLPIRLHVSAFSERRLLLGGTQAAPSLATSLRLASAHVLAPLKLWPYPSDRQTGELPNGQGWPDRRPAFDRVRPLLAHRPTTVNVRTTPTLPRRWVVRLRAAKSSRGARSEWPF